MLIATLFKCAFKFLIEIFFILLGIGQTSGTDCCPFRVIDPAFPSVGKYNFTDDDESTTVTLKPKPRHRVLHNAQKIHLNDKNTCNLTSLFSHGNTENLIFEIPRILKC